MRGRQFPWDVFLSSVKKKKRAIVQYADMVPVVQGQGARGKGREKRKGSE